MTNAPPKVFISYSHDTVEHQERVLGLADRLRAGGIDAEIDQYNAAPPEGWPLWCEGQIAAADLVLMVCTETYHRRVSGDEERGKGLGVVWEARIIRQFLYDANAVSDKFVPVLFSDTTPEQIPTPIKGWTWYVVDTEDGYEALYRRLTGQPGLVRPALGDIRPLPPRHRQWTEATMATGSVNLNGLQPIATAKRGQINLSIAVGNALSQECDVLVLKYAQATYGLDKVVVSTLEANGISITDRLPKPSSYLLVNSNGTIAAKYVHFVGVDRLRGFGYQQIREFSTMALRSLATEFPTLQHVVMTLHGAGYGLDEVEAFNSEIAGIVDAITSGEFPRELAAVTIVEHNPRRAERLKFILERLLPKQGIPLAGIDALTHPVKSTTNSLRTVGYDSASKPHVFVAMPFAEDMEDVYHYGIQGAVNAAGFLCERADSSSFTGDIMSWVKQRIETCSLVIADLSRANPNVYLEVGYAWGRDRPTVLLVNDPNVLEFDVKGHRCLAYNNIRKLEESLRTELLTLKNATVPSAPKVGSSKRGAIPRLP